ncbi:hypothetical protein AX15_000831 [Amanita polypyramis BW_CC]|nr:hypothetical protein AX15_000831 [Amanita polypyramis BW_CC]
MDVNTKKEVKNAIIDLFQKLDIPLTVAGINKELYSDARERILQLGYPLNDATTMEAFEPHLIVGADMIATIYPASGKDADLRTYMAAFNSLIIACDNIFADNPDLITVFNNRLVQGQQQDHPLLEASAQCVQELSKYWDPIMADILRQSTMSFITALTMEHRLKNTQLSNSDSQLARSLREMIAAGMLYALWMFPADAAPEIYMPALPYMNTFIWLSNDILSFYKDELAEKDTNYLSICARSNGTTKLVELRRAVDECIDAYEQVEKLVSGHLDVRDNVLYGLSGVLRHHLSVSGYQLAELLEIGAGGLGA